MGVDEENGEILVKGYSFCYVGWIDSRDHDDYS